MKRLLPLVALLFACGETPTEPTATDLGPLEPSFEATTTASSVQVPVAQIVIVPCANGGAGELVSIQGTLHVLISSTIDDQGGIHLQILNNPRGVTGTGLTTGDKYQGTGVTRQALNINAGGLPQTQTLVNRFLMIGQGPNNNFMVHQLTHFTINENGDPTASVANSSVTCG